MSKTSNYHFAKELTKPLFISSLLMQKYFFELTASDWILFLVKFKLLISKKNQCTGISSSYFWVLSLLYKLIDLCWFWILILIFVSSAFWPRSLLKVLFPAATLILMYSSCPSVPRSVGHPHQRLNINCRGGTILGWWTHVRRRSDEAETKCQIVNSRWILVTIKYTDIGRPIFPLGLVHLWYSLFLPWTNLISGTSSCKTRLGESSSAKTVVANVR